MVDLVLYSDVFRVKKIIKKTSAEGFKELKVGSVFQLVVRGTTSAGGGSSRGNTYARYYTILSGGNNIPTNASMVTVGRYLECFDLEVVK